MYSENASSADNQQERLQENVNYYLSGFVDGEGSFNVSLRRKNDYAIGWQVVLSFNVSQKDPFILDLLKETLGCGTIKRRKCDGLYSYDVTNYADIFMQVIPFFDKYKIFSITKRKNYLIFKDIALLVKQGKQLTRDGLFEVVSLRESLNEGKGRKRKYTIDDVFPEESSQTIRRTAPDMSL
jgi:hypothetical protein